MKRAREDNNLGPQLKRPASLSEESSEPVQGQPRLTTDDALQYLQAVKERFKDDNEKYAEFLEVMKNFKAQRIDTAGVIGKVKELFKGHNKLIIGFNAFLPKGFEIVLPEEPPKKQPVEFDQAINFVNKIKNRFQDNEQVYKAFLEILNKYRKGTKSIGDVYQEVASLFCEHPDLLEEFICFLPESAGSVHANARLGGNSNFRKDEKAVRPSPSERMVKKEKVHLGPDRDTERGSVKVEKEHRRKVEKERDKKDDRENKEREKEDYERELDLDGAQRLPHKRKSARRADELIRKQSQTGEGGDGFSGPSTIMEDKEVGKSASIQKEFAFFEKVKGRLRNRDSYQELLKILNLYNEQIINRVELQSLVTDILEKYPDLLEGFNDLLLRCENAEGCLGSVFARKMESEGTYLKTVKVERDKDKDHEREKDREKEKDKEREREKDKERERDRDRERDREREKERERERTYTSKEGLSHKISLLPSKEKYMNKPISELDLSNGERCTPSYRLLPKNYPRPVSSHRTDLANSVLNDNWVSVTSGSEDYSFKHMRRNQYEESLFRCEDDRFELDMLLESTIITAKHVEELVEKLQETSNQTRIDDCLSAINMRCIERIYGDHGLDILDLMRKNAAVVLPVVLSRLKQKQEEWSKCRSDMNKVWAEVYAKNYHKSLDHRSFYFKQQDKKSLSTKALLTEIKEVHEKMRKEDDSILSTVMGNRRLLMPDLKFGYADPSIHEDLFQIMKYSADEVCSTMEQSDKITRLWTTLLEPMFGVPSRPRGTEDTEEAAKVQVPDLKERGSSSGESAASGGAGNTANGPSQAGKAGVDECATASSKPDSAVLPLHNIVPSHPDQEKKEKVEDIDASENNMPDLKKHADSSGEYQKAGIVLPRSALEGSPKKDDNLESIEGSKSIDAPGQEANIKDSTSRVEEGLSGLENESTRLGSKKDSGTHTRKTDTHGTKAEREEGELSPSPDIDEGQNVDEQALRDRSSKDVVARQEDYDEAEGDVDVDAEHDADADDEGEESAQKSSEDSENASEAGEEVSGSESGDPDDASREDHEDHEEDEDEDVDDEHEEKAESECEAEGMADADDAEGDGISSLASPDRFSMFCKPLAAHPSCLDVSQSSFKDSTIFYGNDMFYILFRLHQTLYERIYSAKTNAIAAEQKWKMVKDSAPPNLYEKFVRVLYNLLDGSADNNKFEDECRSIIGTQSYVLFTLDKLIFKLVKQLQAIVADETASKLLSLHAYEKSRAPGGFNDLVYHANACVLLHDENIYRFELRLGFSELLIQLMEGGSEKLEIPANAMEFSYSNYLSDFLLLVPDSKNSQTVFLSRNKRKSSKPDDCDASLSVMKNAQVVNGLEYKISCKTSKVFYVLDTEDLFHRSKRRTRDPDTAAGVVSSSRGLSERRARMFHDWIDNRLKSLPDRSRKFTRSEAIFTGVVKSTAPS